MPVIVIDAGNAAVQERIRVAASIAVLTESSGTDGHGGRGIDFAGRAELSVRGNSSYLYPKKSYRLELQDEMGKDRKARLLGLPAESDWVLYASFTDRTFTRNLFGHEVWRTMGRYAVRWRFVELFVLTNAPVGFSAAPEELRQNIASVLDVLSRTNGSAPSTDSPTSTNQLHPTLAGSYMGVYLLMEKIKRSPNRLDIARLRAADDSEPAISGGYIIKKDDQGRGERGLLTGQEFKLRFEEPKESELTPAQKSWMSKYLDDFEKSLYSLNFRDPVTGYASFLDVESFIDFHWLVEVSKNADGYWFSQYMHKNRGGKLTMGPVWDFDNAFGNPFFGEARTNGWRFDSAIDPDYTWYRRLFEDPDFLQRYVDRWSELRTNILSTSNVLAMVDRMANAPGLSALQRNAHRWEREGRNVSLRAKLGISHGDEVSQLKEWISGRLAWIDTQEFPKPVVKVKESTRSKGVIVTAAWLNGRCFYTLDGSDPRARGGGVATAAHEYAKPVEIDDSDVVTFRVRSDFGLWSAPVMVRSR